MCVYIYICVYLRSKQQQMKFQPPGFRFEVPTDFISLQVVPKKQEVHQTRSQSTHVYPPYTVYIYMISIFQKIYLKKKLHMYIYI